MENNQVSVGDIILIDGDTRDAYTVIKIDKHGNAEYKDYEFKWRVARVGTFRVTLHKEVNQ